MSDQQPFSPSGIPMPPPNFTTGQPVPAQAPQTFRAPESVPIHVAPTVEQGPQIMPLPQPVSSPVSQQPTVIPVLQNLQGSGSASVAPAIDTSEDNSRIDEVWINKAREIVEKTQYDPFQQSIELSKVKAGYLKARYNKNVKIEEPSQ